MDYGRIASSLITAAKGFGGLAKKEMGAIARKLDTALGPDGRSEAPPLAVASAAQPGDGDGNAELRSLREELLLLSKKMDYIRRRVDQNNFVVNATRKILANSLSDKDALHECRIRGEKYHFYDLAGSSTAYYVGHDLDQGQIYDPDKIGFNPGDTVIDIGANIGIVSIYLAMRFPEVRVLSFEPVARNFENLVKNIEKYNVANVVAAHRAVTGDGRDVEMMMVDAPDTGGTSIYEDLSKYAGSMDDKREVVKSITLDAIFEEHGIEKCKLLKIDCEGAEFEILSKTKMLPRVENLRGEFHRRALKHSTLTIEQLLALCHKQVGAERTNIKVID